MEQASVFFTSSITPDSVISIYKALGVSLSGKVAVKLHSGEIGNQNFIRPPFWKPMIDFVNGTIVECNTAYEGKRNTSEEHWETMKLHGWTEIAAVDIMDEEGDFPLEIPNGKRIQTNYVGNHMKQYDSMLVLSHFKGHPMGGFGGALKNISIGVASSHGKANIHGAGNVKEIWTADHDSFLESMADAAESVVTYFGGNMAFINVMCNLSVDCDCCAVAEDPGRDHLIERIESRNGVHTVEAAEELGFGTRKYQLISLD